ncbi:winged helix-turn-helix domain-containing protein [Nannocystis sp.]|uniref:winged helix-turn-helix domain-containing protein n=1 Tax=Nannocystis sp. TaxID=1962667 RepID=UPI0025D038E3|nr:winged helix-turn-helix domain-containing protein [Nannocystis sp.]MBK7827154.1 winged helix-turn-helix domain-containing protein [Nannocystis sp.]
MDALDAAEAVLRDEGGPLHYREITDRALKRRLWTSEGKTPEATVNSRLAVDIQERGEESRFERVSPGTFSLRNVRKNGRGARGADAVRTAPHIVEAQDKSRQKLGVQEIRDLARQIVKDSPEGIRYGQLLTQILDRHPATPRNTVQGSIWNLDVQFPAEIFKPARGLFKAGPASEPAVVAATTARSPDRLKEEAFYEPFADWLKNDAGDATDAMALGGSGLGLSGVRLMSSVSTSPSPPTELSSRMRSSLQRSR